MVRAHGLRVSDVCSDTKLGETAALRWLAQSDEEAEGRSGTGKPLAAKHPIIRQSEAEKQQLRGDVDMLKKYRYSLPANFDEPLVS